jgi:hypothetical protein
MNEPTAVTQLGQFTSSEYTRPGVVVLDGREVVVLDYATEDTVEVWHDGVISRHPGTTTVTEVTDAERWQVAVRRALLSLNHQRVQAIQEQADAQARQTEVLEQIRAYAIGKHRQGAFDQESLNEFLDHFGLRRYGPPSQLRFEISGSYEVDTTDQQAARTLATDALMASGTDLICDRDSGSVRSVTQVLDVAAVTPPDAAPRVRVDYRITGEGSVTRDDLDQVRTEAEATLRPDLAHIPGLIPGSDQHRVEVELEPTD